MSANKITQVLQNSEQPQNGACAPSEREYRFVWGDFAALSYTWGDACCTEIILLDGRETEVRTNLADALRTFRKENCFSGRYYLWVDAVCINQRDDSERASQVKKMSQLYAGCWTVMVFLGKAENESDKAVQLLKTLASAWRAKRSWELRKDFLNDPRHLGLEGAWLAFHDLLKRTYWGRLWIIQEVSLPSSDHLVFAGNARLSWSDVQDGILSIHDYDTHWTAWRQYLENDCEILGVKSEDPRSRPTSNLQHMKKLCEVARTKRTRGRLEFIDILDIARNTCCSEPLDRVYGLLNIMESDVACEIDVSYSVRPSGLFAQVSRVIMQKRGRMDLLCEASMWRNQFDAPSWALDWIWQSAIARDKAAHQLSKRKYQADAGTTPHFSFSLDGLVLTARGAIVGTIDGVRRSRFYPDAASRGVDLQHSEAVLKDTYGSLPSLEVSFYRTLVGLTGDIPASVVETEPKDERGCLDAFVLQETLGQAWLKCPDYAEALKIDGWPRNGNFEKVRPGVESAFKKLKSSFWQFYWVSSGRTLVTTREGRFGWAPDNVVPLSEEIISSATYARHDRDQVRPGDRFVILFGCKVPLVVREHRDGFKILGEGFLDGFMDGRCQAEMGNGQLVQRDMKFY